MNRLVQLIYRLSVLVMLSMLSVRRFCCFLHQAFVWFIMTAGLSSLAVEMLEIWTDGSEKNLLLLAGGHFLKCVLNFYQLNLVALPLLCQH